MHDEWFNEWVENQTTHLDLVASWETLNQVYDQLNFHDEITDVARLEEFRWVIQEVNKFLTRQRTALFKQQKLSDAYDYLHTQYATPTTIRTRQALAYHKLKQQWVTNALSNLKEHEIEGEQNGGEFEN